MKKNQKKFKILALDGGGVRSILESEILRRLVIVYPNLLDEIDMIAGISLKPFFVDFP